MDAIYISREGHKKLYERYLKIDQQIANIQMKMQECARNHNSDEQNSEYLNLRREALYNLPQKKAELYDEYKNAIIIEDTDEYKSFDGKTVIKASRVELLFDGEPEVFDIMGKTEEDTDNNIISYETPLAKKILGKKAGEKVQLNDIEICIVSVTRI